jgi:AraC-like DNA-binding protein
MQTVDGENETGSVREVGYAPRASGVGLVEVTSIATLRRRGGPEEFRRPQRLGFELALVIEDGQCLHEVDFARFPLSAGDVLWVHPGQVQRWGRIDDIDGLAIMMRPEALPSEVAALLTRPSHDRNLWPGVAPTGSPVSQAASILTALSPVPVGADRHLREAALRHAVLAFLLVLASSSPAGSDVVRPTSEAFDQFRAQVETDFAQHRSVAWYAERLGYSSRTLNRVAQAGAGLSAKDLIDRRVILEAKRLLAHETVPASDVAARLSFEDPANFSAYFRARTGMSPGAFRRHVRPD